jgi:hypothetical protein
MTGMCRKIDIRVQSVQMHITEHNDLLPIQRSLILAFSAESSLSSSLNVKTQQTNAIKIEKQIVTMQIGRAAGRRGCSFTPILSANSLIHLPSCFTHETYLTRNHWESMHPTQERQDGRG